MMKEEDDDVLLAQHESVDSKKCTTELFNGAVVENHSQQQRQNQLDLLDDYDHHKVEEDIGRRDSEDGLVADDEEDDEEESNGDEDDDDDDDETENYSDDDDDAEYGEYDGDGGGDRRGTERQKCPEDDILRPGDHIFAKKGLQQRHAIVMDVPDAGNQEKGINVNPRSTTSAASLMDDIGYTVRVTVLTFYENAVEKQQKENKKRRNRLLNFRRTNGSHHGKADEEEQEPLFDSEENDFLHDENYLQQEEAAQQPSEIRRITLRQFARNWGKVRKVRYGVTRRKRMLQMGTVTCVEADESGLIMERIKFLLDHPYFLPKYRRLSANDECAVFWCRTGRWITIRGASILKIVTSLVTGSAVAATGLVSQMSVTYYYSYGPWLLSYAVPATVAYPILMPLLVGYGMTSLVPLEILRRNRKKWQDISERLNRQFWSDATEDFKGQYFGNSVSGTGDKMAEFFGMKINGKDVDEAESLAQYTAVHSTNMDEDDHDESDYENESDYYDDDDEDHVRRKCDRIARSLNNPSSKDKNGNSSGAADILPDGPSSSSGVRSRRGGKEIAEGHWKNLRQWWQHKRSERDSINMRTEKGQQSLVPASSQRYRDHGDT